MKVIAYKNLPKQLPISSTISIYLLLDKAKAHDGLWIAFGIIMTISWIVIALSCLIQEEIDLLEPSKKEQTKE